MSNPKSAILQKLSSTRGTALVEIIEGASRELDVSKSCVKVAIWELYSEGLVQLTPEWDLMAV